MPRAKIEPYSDAWPCDFARIAKHIRACLGSRALRIDHMQAGFQELSVPGDHRPPGQDGPEADWSKRLFLQPDHERRTDVHVRVEGRPNQRYALLFRDYLRAHPLAADAYAELKRRLARELRDRVTYAEVKDPACELIIVAAETWARATAWKPGPSDA